MDFFLLLGLSGLECFALLPYCKRSWCFSSLYPHQNVTLTFFFVLLRCIFHSVRGPVLSTADLHSIYPIWSLSFQTFGHYSPLFSTKLIERKKIKQLWFLKCTVDPVLLLFHITVVTILWKNSLMACFGSIQTGILPFLELLTWPIRVLCKHCVEYEEPNKQ